MKNIKKLFCLFFIFVFTNLQLRAAYTLKDGSQKEKNEKYALCENLFKDFVLSEKFEKLFYRIIFDSNKCCCVLFNCDKTSYNLWLNVPINENKISIDDDKLKVKKEVIRIGDLILSLKEMQKDFFRIKKDFAEKLSKKVPKFFYEDMSKRIMWDSPTDLNYEFPSGTKEKICICGFIECLSMLMKPWFYYEIFNEDFALRCRIFVFVFMSFLMDYLGDEVSPLAFSNSLFLKKD